MSINTLKRRAHRIMTGTATFDERFVPDHKELVELIGELRASGSVVVFTTGVWDLFHIGHGEYIQKGKDEARNLYQNAERIIMVVGVDTDALTKERKGPKRPIVPEDERYRVLGHLRAVDIITPQYKIDQLYQIIEHDVRIISTSTQDLPANHDEMKKRCAHLINLPPQSQTSTTSRVRGLVMDGGLEAIDKVENLVSEFQRKLKELRDELAQ